MPELRILITGGAGFLGSNLARYILQNDRGHVTILDDFSTGREANISGLRVDVIRGDVDNAELVAEAVKEKHLVFHFAARNVIVGNTQPFEDIRTNIAGTYKVFDACAREGVERIVYASTSSIYGNSIRLPAAEMDAPQFLNNYSVSKYAGEAYAGCFWERHRLPITVNRYSNVYGYNQWPDNPYSGVVGKFIGWAIQDRPLKIHGDGTQTRDFTFVDDACEATWRAATSPTALGQIYNVGTGVETSVKDLARHIVRATNSRSGIEHIELRDVDNIRRRVLDIERAKKDLGFSPRFTLATGLSETIRWEREQALLAY